MYILQFTVFYDLGTYSSHVYAYVLVHIYYSVHYLEIILFNLRLAV